MEDTFVLISEGTVPSTKKFYAYPFERLAQLEAENAAMRRQIIEGMQAQTTNGERIAELVAENARLMHDLMTEQDRFRDLVARMARPAVADEDDGIPANALRWSF